MNPDWEGEARQLFDLLLPHLDGMIHVAAQTGWERLDLDGDPDWAQINAVARAWAREHTFELVTGITDTTRAIYQEQVDAWLASGEPLSALSAALEPYLGAVRAERVAVTEVTRLYAEGNLLAWRESGVVEEVMWMTAEDDIVMECPICWPLNGLTEALAVRDGFGGYGAPPAHVRCRCWLKPIVNAAKWLARWRQRWEHAAGLPVHYPEIAVREAA